MNFLVLKKNRMSDYLESIRSINLGFYFSFLLHLFILLLAVGLPNFFYPKSINVPTIIPVEIINITDFDTYIPKNIKSSESKEIKKTIVKEKKFNSSDNQDIKKVEIKDKPLIKKNKIEKKINLKEDIIINKKKEITKTPIKLKKEDIKIDSKIVESLPSKKIKPKLKPKPDPTINNLEKKLDLVTQENSQKNLETKSDVVIKEKLKQKPAPEFSIASMLKDLRNEESTITIQKETVEKNEEIIENDGIEINKEAENQAKISIANAIVQQIQMCWIVNSGENRKNFKESQYIVAEVEYERNGNIVQNSVQIVDTNIIDTSILISGVKYALYNCRLILPEEYYYLWKKNRIRFDHDFMKKKSEQKNMNLFN